MKHIYTCLHPFPSFGSRYSLHKDHVGAVWAVLVRLASIFSKHVEGVVMVKHRIQACSSLILKLCTALEEGVDAVDLRAVVQSVGLTSPPAFSTGGTMVWICEHALNCPYWPEGTTSGHGALRQAAMIKMKAERYNAQDDHGTA